MNITKPTICIFEFIAPKLLHPIKHKIQNSNLINTAHGEVKSYLKDTVKPKFITNGAILATKHITRRM